MYECVCFCQFLELLLKFIETEPLEGTVYTCEKCTGQTLSPLSAPLLSLALPSLSHSPLPFSLSLLSFLFLSLLPPSLSLSSPPLPLSPPPPPSLNHSTFSPSCRQLPRLQTSTTVCKKKTLHCFTSRRKLL